MLPIKYLYSTKEKRELSPSSGPIKIKSIHHDKALQNYESRHRCSTAIPSHMGIYPRHTRRLPPCTYSAFPSQISGFFPRRPAVLLSQPAFRTGTSTMDIHETAPLATKITTHGRGACSSVPRRCPSVGIITSGRTISPNKDTKSAAVTRFPNKLGKVGPSTEHRLQLVGYPMGYYEREVETPTGEGVSLDTDGPRTVSQGLRLTSPMGTTSRSGRLRLPDYTSHEGIFLSYSGPATRSPDEGTRYNSSSSRSIEAGSATVDSWPATGKVCTVHANRTAGFDMDGRIASRMGSHSVGRPDRSGEMVVNRKTTAYKSFRNSSGEKSSSVPRPPALPYQVMDRQRNRAIRHYTNGEQVTGDTSDGLATTTLSTVPPNPDADRPNPLNLKRGSGCAEQGSPTTDGVVRNRGGVSNNRRVARPTGSGSNGHSTEQETARFCVTLPSSISSSSRCSRNRLECMETDIHLPSEKLHSTDHTETPDIQTPRCTDNTPATHSSVVSNNPETITEIPPGPSVTPATSTGQDSMVNIRGLDRMEFLKRAWCSLHGEKVAENLIKAQRSSTCRQFQSSWKSFQKWLPAETPVITKQTVLEYLVYLRDERKLQPRTILTHRAALALPLSLSFDINTSDKEFSLLSKAQFLSCPPAQPRLPTWSLNKALESLSAPPFEQPSSIDQIFLKALFLVALASGNRVSELAAGVRTGTSITASSVSLLVRSGFLYKNQSINRTPPPICFPSIDMQHPLCPALALQKYLDSTSSQPHQGAIFVHPASGRPLKAGRLSYWLWKAIETLATPSSRFGGHDVRKLSHSVAWLRGVPTDTIVKNGFWQSQNIFINNYCTSLLVPSVTFVAGRTVING